MSIRPHWTCLSGAGWALGILAVVAIATVEDGHAQSAVQSATRASTSGVQTVTTQIRDSLQCCRRETARAPRKVQRKVHSADK
jgi:hypothetical protein